jgi:enterochelin esterase-like enzyme
VATPSAAIGATSRTIPFVGPIEGTLRERRFYSGALDRDMSYYVYLPPGYGIDAQHYPVLYMLHGGGGSKDEWLAYGLVDALDRLIASHDVQPSILILPQGDTGYWVNQPGGPRWGDYVAFDLVRQVDATFRTLSDEQHRAIGGLSMGGAGALQLAFNHPTIFGVVGAHCPALHRDDGTFSLYGTGADFVQREPIDLAAVAPGIENLHIWIDAGELDPWLERDRLLDQVLASRGIPHTWRTLPGGHEGPYWQRNSPTYLRFYDAAFGHVLDNRSPSLTRP